MDALELRRRIMELMDEYAPKGVTFEWDRATRRFGCCHNRRNRFTGEVVPYKITISYPLASRNSWEEVRKVVLHEIAHARTAGHHHDEVWRRECLAIGGDGKRCYDSEEDGGNVVTLPKKYIGTCPVCGRQFPRSRRPHNAYHCDSRQLINWKINPKFVA